MTLGLGILHLGLPHTRFAVVTLKLLQLSIGLLLTFIHTQSLSSITEESQFRQNEIFFFLLFSCLSFPNLPAMTLYNYPFFLNLEKNVFCTALSFSLLFLKHFLIFFI